MATQDSPSPIRSETAGRGAEGSGRNGDRHGSSGHGSSDHGSSGEGLNGDRSNGGGAGSAGSQIRWIESNMQTAFANVVNVQSTREQFDLFFGTNQTWNPEHGDGVTVQLSNRVMLSPHAAKRLAGVLSSVLTEYERRFGTIAIAP